MKVSVAEFKSEIDRYLELAGEEEIVLTKDGKHFARITPESEDLRTVIHSLRGILPENATLEEAHKERMAKHERHLLICLHLKIQLPGCQKGRRMRMRRFFLGVGVCREWGRTVSMKVGFCCYRTWGYGVVW